MFIHVFGDKNSPVEQLITWVPAHGMAKRGCPSTTYITKLLRDAGLENLRDFKRCTRDQTLWDQFSSCCLLGIKWKYM